MKPEEGSWRVDRRRERRKVEEGREMGSVKVEGGRVKEKRE